MNKLSGFISDIQSSHNISIVEVVVKDHKFYSVVLGSMEEKENSTIYVGKDVYILFKETEVSIAKNFSGYISLRNRLDCTIVDIHKGNLLTKVLMRWRDEIVTSIITTSSANRLDLKTGDKVTAFIKSNEITIMEK